MPGKALLIRFSSIGDVVLTTPVIRCLRQQTDLEVHFLTKRSFAPVLAANPHLTRLWTIDKSIAEIAPALNAAGFTHLIDLHGNLRTLELKARLLLNAARSEAPTPKIRTFLKLNFEKFLLTRFGINRMPDLHIVDRYLATVAPLNVNNDGGGLDYFIPPEEAVDLTTAGLPHDYLAFVIGAAHATKRLTEAQMAAVCQGLVYPVVLLGGAAEREMGERLARSGEHVINACGRFSLNGSADLVRQARAVLTHDTGLMHVAAAFRKPIISVWGNTVPGLGMYPYLPEKEELEKQRRQEVVGLACRPCSKIGYAKCPQGHFRCIKDQVPETLVSAVRALLPND